MVSVDVQHHVYLTVSVDVQHHVYLMVSVDIQHHDLTRHHTIHTVVSVI